VALRESNSENAQLAPNEESIDQVLRLLERVRGPGGVEIDESSLLAVAETMGVPIEHVRLANKLRSEKEKKSFADVVKGQFLTLESHTRTYVTTGILASLAALLIVLEDESGHRGILIMVAMVAMVVGMYNVSLSRDRKIASIAGGLFGGGLYLMYSIFGTFLGTIGYAAPGVLIPTTAVGSVVGLMLNVIVSKNRTKLGLKDPATKRQELLRELHKLRDRLYSGERSLTFLSVDIVGSTLVKRNADPLAVEFSFNEYYGYVERISQKYGGQLHSRAGDGVICAFEQPGQAFAAAKNIQAEIIEFNKFRNRLDVPIAVRCGIHSGTVLAPDAANVKSLNFADVIDIASHLQKCAPPGGVVISEVSSVGIPGGWLSVSNNVVEADGTRGGVWTFQNPERGTGPLPKQPIPPTNP
jgi:class 3 adenylate cyclase